MSEEQDAIDFLFNNMRFEKIPIDRILPNPKNPRVELKPGIPMYEKLKASIDHFNYMDPIVWNEQSGMIVSGHQRFNVLQVIANERGITLTEVPVIVVNMSQKEEDTYMISANRITGIWDNEKLSELFATMDDEYRQLTGFDDTEIQALMDDIPIDIPDEEGPSGATFEKQPKKVICPHCGKEFEV